MQLSDANFADYTIRFCGDETPNVSWRSKGPLARVRFVSDGSVTNDGFNIFYTFNDNCPTGEYQVGDWSEVSTMHFSDLLMLKVMKL